VRTPSAWPLFCNYISAFLAAGGYGDGRLNYRPKQIVETYYALRVLAGRTIAGDFQRTPFPHTTWIADGYRLPSSGSTGDTEAANDAEKPHFGQQINGR
jgi:hypothetical protein